MASLAEYLQKHNVERLRKIALKKGTMGPTLTYGQLFSEAEQLARKLPRKTVISLALNNTIEYVVCFLAIGMAGSVVAPLNPGYSESEFEFYLKRSPGGLIGSNPAANRAAKKVNIPILQLKDLKEIGEPLPEIANDDTHLILFTSGTTGEPKSVPLSHANLIASVENISHTYRLTDIDTTIAIMPLFHIHGLMASLFSTLATGGTVILPSTGKFSAATFFTELIDNKCTWFSAVPTMHHILLQTKEPRFSVPTSTQVHQILLISARPGALGSGRIYVGS
jgi:acyl-CoA synthetase (AMP-forming)/AMP-acid ligase II